MHRCRIRTYHFLHGSTQHKLKYQFCYNGRIRLGRSERKYSLVRPFFIRLALRTNGSESSERTNVRALRIAKTAQITWHTNGGQQSSKFDLSGQRGSTFILIFMKVFQDCHVMCGDVKKFIAHHWELYQKHFSCDQAALRTLLSVRPSVRPSVCLSVCLCLFVTPFHYVPVVVSLNFQELLPLTKVMWCPCKRSRSEVKSQGHRGQNPI